MGVESGTRTGLNRTFGLVDGVALVLGVVVGAGILSAPGLVAGYLGSPWLILAIWAFGGLSAALATLVYAELATMMPQAGGKYLYVLRAYGEMPACFTGWADFLLIRPFGPALKAVLIGQYLVALVGRGSPKAIAAAVVVGFVLLHLGGVRTGKLFQNVSTAVKLVLLLALAAAGFAIRGGGASWHLASLAPAGLASGLTLASQAVFFTYSGMDLTVSMAGEVRAPGRNLPRMLLLGLAGVTVLFLLINAACLNALTPAVMARSPFVARDVLAKALGARAGAALAILAIAALVNSLNSSFLMVPRGPFGLARDRLAPRALARVSRRGTPTLGLYLFGGLVLAVALSGTVELIIRLLSFMTLAVDGLVLTTVFCLRRQAPQATRPFRVPLYPFLPAAAVISYATMLAMVTFTQPRFAAGGALLLAIAAAGSWIAMRIRAPLVATVVAEPAD